MVSRTGGAVEPPLRVDHDVHSAGSRRSRRVGRKGRRQAGGQSVEPPSGELTFLRRPTVRDPLPAFPLRPLIANYTATFGIAWSAVTRRKHADDFARFIAWLTTNGRAVTTAALDFLLLPDYVADLLSRPTVRC